MPTAPPLKTGPFRSAEPVPAVVQAAFWILVASGVLTGIVLLIGAGSIVAEATAYTPALVAAALGGLVGILIRIGIAVMLRRGYAPARGYLTVVSVLSTLVTVLRGLDPLSLLLLALVVTAVVLVWLPSASRYFRVVTNARKRAVAAGAKIAFLG